MSGGTISMMPECRPLKSNEFCVTIVCDGLHPDDVEELQRVLAGNRYDFKVEIDQNVQAEHYPELNVIRIRTKLFVRFSAKWFYGQTRQGGVKTVVKAIDEVLDKSSHDRDRRPQVSFDSNGQELITTETWLRPRTKKHSWTRDHKLALGILMLTGVAALAAIFVVPEFRRVFHLDKPEPTQQAETKPTQSITTPTPTIQAEPAKPESSKPKKVRPSQKTTTHASGNQTGSTANAPNGIAITGGNVQNPTVNNFAPTPPHVTWRATANEKGIVVSINSDKMFSNGMFTVTCDSSCKYVSMNMGVYAMMATDRPANDRTWEFTIGQFNPAGTLEIQFSGDAGFKITDVTARF